MTYPPQPGNWNDPSRPSREPTSYQDPAQPAGGQPSGGQPSGGEGYPAPGSLQPGYPAPGYPAYGYPIVAVAPPTNGMSIAAMVLGISGILGLCGYGVGGFIGIVGAILGHVSRRQIRERGESGDGMALAGIITGWISTVIALLATAAIVIFFVWLANQDPSTYDSNTGYN